MAKAIAKAELDFRLTFEVNETEAAALAALAGYGDDAFIKAFYEKLGNSYMEKHEAGLREFLRSIREVVTPALQMVSGARIALKKADK